MFGHIRFAMKCLLNFLDVFLGLMSMDFGQMVKFYKKSPAKCKWNVLKNLVYYSFKLTLFHVSQMFDENARCTFANILNSIYNYVFNFNYILNWFFNFWLLFPLFWCTNKIAMPFFTLFILKLIFFSLTLSLE